MAEPRPARAGLCTSRTSAELNFGDDITGNEPVTERVRAHQCTDRTEAWRATVSSRWTDFRQVWPPGDTHNPDSDLFFKYAGPSEQLALLQALVAGMRNSLRTQVKPSGEGITNDEALSGRDRGHCVGSNHAGAIRRACSGACRTGRTGCLVGGYRPGPGWSRSWRRDRLHGRASHCELVGVEAIG